jgi:hypothetical protein
VEQILSGLVSRLQSAFGDGLTSVVLYGSAAVGDWNENSSDLNILCVLRSLTPHELAQSEPVFRWWREQGNPPPLLMSAEEVRSSTDCFPMEFYDIKEQRRVLQGADVIRDLEIDRSFYRAQVEHELRVKQIRLRQKAAELFSRPQLLLKLLVDSISTFCVLGRHALILSGREPRWKKQEIVAALEDALRRPLDGANAILAIRSERKPQQDANATLIFEKYLGEMNELVRFVDALER